jgi:hypothetical protein
MSLNDTGYYRGRAIEEAALAKSASCEVAAAVHAELALRYQALVDEAEGRPPVGMKASNFDVSPRPKLGVRWISPAQ